jgi:hypothetical protein
MVIAREVVGAGSDPDLHPPAGESLGHGHLAGQQERMAGGCIQDVDTEGDAPGLPRHRDEQGGSVPGLAALRRRANVIEAS